MKYKRRPHASKQRGITLIIGLIMLVLLTLMAISAMRLGTDQTVIISNAQQQTKAIMAAQTAIDTVMNSSAFTTNPAAAITVSNCPGGGANVLCVATDGSSTPDFKVAISPTPTCVTGGTIPANQLDLSQGANSPDLSCLSSAQQSSFGTSGAATGNSLCANSVWEVNATATSLINSTATATVTQGIGQKILASELATYCP